MAQAMSDGGSVTPLPNPKRARRAQPSLYLALLAGLLTMIGLLVYLRNMDSSVTVAVAARTIAQGEVVHEADVRYVDVGAGDSVAGTLLQASDVRALSGRIAAGTITQGDLVHRSDLVDPGQGPQLRAMSIPIDPTRAAGGTLRKGDRVDVIDASGLAPAYVVVNAQVLEVGDAGGGKVGASTADYAITVAVDEASALRLSAAITADKVDIVRSTGATPVTASSPPTTVKR